MAGSYSHVSGEDGGWSLIENMGDAHECVEELLWLVHRAIGDHGARQLLDAEFYPMKRGERSKDDALLLVGKVMEA